MAKQKTKKVTLADIQAKQNEQDQKLEQILFTQKAQSSISQMLNSAINRAGDIMQELAKQSQLEKIKITRNVNENSIEISITEKNTPLLKDILIELNKKTEFGSKVALAGLAPSTVN